MPTLSKISPQFILRWAVLLLASLCLDWLLSTLEVPAALLLGPMICGVCFGVFGLGLRLPKVTLYAAQSVIGCLIARSLTPSVLVSVAGDWFEIGIVVLVSIVFSGFVGWAIAKTGTLSPTTAGWGSTPGAAAAMVSMAEAYGADVRLVAFMQYVRVLIVVLTASSTSRVLLSLAGAHAPQALAVATRHPALLPFLGTVAIGAVGATIGWRFRIPAGGLLVPMVLGAIFQGSGAVSITLPGWLLAVAYTGIGLFIGLGFNREVLFKALKALPQMMLATLMLILLCGLTAWMLVVMLHVDPLTAYLATTPGGVDTVTIITVGSQADVPLVLAVQTARIFAIILTGPYIVKLIERHGTPVWRFQMPWA